MALSSSSSSSSRHRSTTTTTSSSIGGNSRRTFLSSAVSVLASFSSIAAVAQDQAETTTDDDSDDDITTKKYKIQKIPKQYIAAIGSNPKANQGDQADQWGLWTVDPGPRGVLLKDYDKLLKSKNNIGPYGWKFNPNDWWLEEHGIIMESPDFSTTLKPGKYVVTGGREITTILTIDNDGKNWKLNSGTLGDVTHLPCRSARYTSPTTSNNTCNPSKANKNKFPIRPGGIMPNINGCKKQDYAVLFVTGKVIDDNDNYYSSEESSSQMPVYEMTPLFY